MTDRETLVAALRERGVDWLAPSDAAGGEALAPADLIASLAAHRDSRLRQALLGLFLLQPRLAALAPEVRPRLDESAANELVAFYTAAVYLQRMWRVRLGHYLPEVAELPDHFSAELGLPRPEEEHGKAGLYALADWHAAHSPHRYNHRSAYEGVADLLFDGLRRKRAPREPAAAS